MFSNIYCIPCFEYSYKSIHLMSILIINIKEEILENVEKDVEKWVIVKLFWVKNSFNAPKLFSGKNWFNNWTKWINRFIK